MSQDIKRAKIEQRGKRLLKQLKKFAAEAGNQTASIKRRVRARARFFRCMKEVEGIRAQITSMNYGKEPVSKHALEQIRSEAEV